MAGKFVVKKSGSGQFMFNLKAANGEVILTSELYQNRAGVQAGIDSVKKRAAKDAHYRRKLSGRLEPYFVLKADNGQVIGTSEMYSSVAAREDGIASVKVNAPTAKVEDLTVVFPPPYEGE